MSVTRGNVEATKAFIRARLGNPYVYGGALSTNVRQGTDCSEVWQTVLESVYGRWQPGRQHEGATTESYRRKRQGGSLPDGVLGPFGTVDVNHWSEIPANAAAKIAFHHGPGGGANSHMWGELDGMLIESGGSKGLVTNGRALAVNAPYATAWCYLPGPIDGVGAPAAPIGEGSYGADVIAFQQKLNREGAGLEVDGEYGPKTTAAAIAFDRRTVYARATLAEGQRRGITPRGIQIAFSVPFVETEWKMYANSKVPESLAIKHDAVGSDHDSVGLWQQRCPMWGPAHVLMDPTQSAGLFFDRLVAVNLGTAKAPIRYNETSRLPGDFAAEVQRPAREYRGRYQERMGHAVALYDRITNPTSDVDPIEELLMSNLEVESLSIYATPGEPKIPIVRMIQAIDAADHRRLVEQAASLGDPDSIQRIARTAAGQGKFRDPATINHAVAVLNQINATNPQAILAATPGKA